MVVHFCNALPLDDNVHLKAIKKKQTKNISVSTSKFHKGLQNIVQASKLQFRNCIVLIDEGKTQDFCNKEQCYFLEIEVNVTENL